MHFQFDMSALTYPHLQPAQVTSSQTDDLMRQMLEVQKEQLANLRAFVSAHDGSARWRAFLARWREDFPELPDACRQAMPVLERSYGKLISELTENLSQDGNETLDN